MFQTNSNETKILGVPWNKLTDINFYPKISTNSNQKNYSKLCGLNIWSTTYYIFYHVLGKVIYSELCDGKISWAAESPEHLKNKFVK